MPQSESSAIPSPPFLLVGTGMPTLQVRLIPRRGDERIHHLTEALMSEREGTLQPLFQGARWFFREDGKLYLFEPARDSEMFSAPVLAGKWRRTGAGLELQARSPSSTGGGRSMDGFILVREGALVVEAVHCLTVMTRQRIAWLTQALTPQEYDIQEFLMDARGTGSTIETLVARQESALPRQLEEAARGSIFQGRWELAEGNCARLSWSPRARRYGAGMWAQRRERSKGTREMGSSTSRRGRKRSRRAGGSYGPLREVGFSWGGGEVKQSGPRAIGCSA